jgi:heptosyltransferase I
LNGLATRQFQRILLIKPSALGDVVHAIPVLAELRNRYPSAQINWLLTPENAELVREHPALSNVVLFRRKELAGFGRNWKATRGVLELLWQIRRKKYDLVIDLHGQFRSAVFAIVAGAPVRVGFDRPRRREGDGTPARGWRGAREGSWMAYTHRIPIPDLNIHAVDRYLSLGKLLGFSHAAPDFRMHLPESAHQAVETLLKPLDQKPVALLVPGTIWETKHWTIEGFAETARHFQMHGFAVVLAGTRHDFARCEAIASHSPGALNLAGATSVAGLAALIQRAAISVSNDSGSMHLAAALGTPVVAVFGPTDPARVGPYGQPEAVVRTGISCSPCNFRKLSQCPNSHACMQDLRAESVIKRAAAILETGHPILAGKEAGGVENANVSQARPAGSSR